MSDDAGDADMSTCQLPPLDSQLQMSISSTTFTVNVCYKRNLTSDNKSVGGGGGGWRVGGGGVGLD